MVIMVVKNVHLEVDEKAWIAFRKSCLDAGTTVAKRLAEYVEGSPVPAEVERVANTIPVTAKALRDRDLVGKVPGVVKASELGCAHKNKRKLQTGKWYCDSCGSFVG